MKGRDSSLLGSPDGFLGYRGIYSGVFLYQGFSLMAPAAALPLST